MLQSLGIVVPDISVHVENLSGGQRQSIAIGRAASFAPKVLIMDEPTAALAVAEVEAVLDLIRTVSAKGVSVILITHRLQDLFLVCDRLQVMYEGRSIAERAIRGHQPRGGRRPHRRPQVQRPVGQDILRHGHAAGSAPHEIRCPVTAPLHATTLGTSGRLRPRTLKERFLANGSVGSIALFFAAVDGAVLGHDRRLSFASTTS